MSSYYDPPFIYELYLGDESKLESVCTAIAKERNFGVRPLVACLANDFRGQFIEVGSDVFNAMHVMRQIGTYIPEGTQWKLVQKITKTEVLV